MEEIEQPEDVETQEDLDEYVENIVEIVLNEEEAEQN